MTSKQLKLLGYLLNLFEPLCDESHHMLFVKMRYLVRCELGNYVAVVTEEQVCQKQLPL